jgi:predicted signal transduction protein with EAL and GGDEF domain
VIFPELAAPSDLGQVVDKLAAHLAEPIAMDGVTLDITSSVGSAVFDPLTDDARSLIMRADISMYEAKRARSADKTTRQ